MSTPRVQLAPQERILEYPKGLAEFLDLARAPEALVTDWSTLSDFELNKPARRQLYRRLGYVAHASMPIWTIARDLEKRREVSDAP